MKRLHRGAALVCVAFAATACSDLLLNDPAPPFGDVSLDLTAAMQLLQDEETVLPQANRLEIRLRPLGGGEGITRNRAFDWNGSEVRVQIPVTLRSESEAWELRLVISIDGAPLYVGEDEVTLTRGETTSVAPVLDSEVATVEVTGETTITALGEVVSYVATARYATGDPVTGAQVTLASSNPSILVAEGSSSFRSVAAGSARIQATARAGATEIADATGQLAVAVAPVPSEITIDPSAAVVAVGSTVTFNATSVDRNGNVISAPLTWVSDDASVATVDGTGASGRVTGESFGTTTIRAEFRQGGAAVTTGTASLEVTSRVDRIDVTPDGTLTLSVNESVTLDAVARNAAGEAVDIPIEWTVGDPSIASIQVTDEGRSITVTGVEGGSTMLVGTAADVTVEKRVDVGLGGGDIQVTLFWDTTADLDLWMTDPNGERVYYGNRTSQSGATLDFDDTDGFGPENIFWNLEGAPLGIYTVQVDHFSGASPTNWEVRVRVLGEELIYTGTISTGQTVTVLTIEYTDSGPVPVAGDSALLMAPANRDALPRPVKSGRR